MTEQLERELMRVISDAETWRKRMQEAQEYAWWIFEDKDEEFFDNDFWPEIHISAGEAMFELHNLAGHAKKVLAGLPALAQAMKGSERMVASAVKTFPTDQHDRGLELRVDFGEGEQWAPVRAVWHGNDKVNFSLKNGGGWLAYEPDKIIEVRRDAQ